MDRVIAPGSVVVSGADTPPLTGTPGHWTSGSPGAAQATTLPGYWVEGVQEEIMGVIIGAGETPDRTNNGQMAAAIKGAQSLATNGYQKLFGGLIIQWGVVYDSGTSAITVTFPIPFPHACLNIQATNQTVNTPPAAWPGVQIENPASFAMYQSSASEVGAAGTAFWFAIGY